MYRAGEIIGKGRILGFGRPTEAWDGTKWHDGRGERRQMIEKQRDEVRQRLKLVRMEGGWGRPTEAEDGTKWHDRRQMKRADNGGRDHHGGQRTTVRLE